MVGAVVGCAVGAGDGGAGGLEAVPPTAIETRLVLIGDAGKPAPGFEPVLAALQADLTTGPDSTIVVFLGDNIYEKGMPDNAHPERREMERRLDDQIAVLRHTETPGIFVPGNHDWGWGETDGWRVIEREERFIAERGGGLASLLPSGGCPGPVVRDVGAHVRLVLLDTQWWFHSEPRPVQPGRSCADLSMGDVADSIRAVLRTAGARHVAILAHHPVRSAGRHGGYFDWKVHLFPLRELHPALWVPLPIIGSAYPVARRLGIADQDLNSAAYGRMIDSLRSAVRGGDPLLYAGGHEHNLQVFRDQDMGYAMVSGAGVFGHTSPAFDVEDVVVALQVPGYMRVDVLSDGRVQLTLVAVDARGRGEEVHRMWLRQVPLGA
jgi:hypothetical protein